MQLVSISIYHQDGRRKDVKFELGKLNIITGHSRTGKSSLITIVDYCLGRDSAPIPRTKWFNAISWYVTIWQFADGSRALLGRPSSPSEKGTSKAMLEFGGSDLVAPSFEALRVNTDSDALRAQVGALMGLANVQLERSQESFSGPFSVGLGSAALFSLQEQHEIDSKVLLFHRQNEHRIAENLRDTLPFFLGAVEGEQASKRARLRELERAARRAEVALQRYTAEAENKDGEIRQLLSEANAVGLVEATPESIDDALTELNRIRFDRTVSAPQVTADIQAQNAQHVAEQRRYQLSQQLSGLLGRRDLLLDQQSGEGGYTEAVELQINRLQALDILPTKRGGDSSGSCPVCGQELSHPDPTPTEMRESLETLHTHLAEVRKVAPYRRGAIVEIDQRIQITRDQLNEVNAALSATASHGGDVDANALKSAQEFVRGRIDAILYTLQSSQPEELAKLKTQRDLAISSADALRRELDGEDAVDKLTSRLSIVGTLLGKYSQRLRVEQANNPMRLDIKNLTIVVDTPGGPLPLQNIGSGENWVGYHVAAHLALHEFFVTQNRPTPRVLMLDQPSKAHFQSGTSADSDDRDSATVRNLYRVVARFATEFAGQFQVIAIDHAEYEEDWFADAIRYNWRNGLKLIPDDWVDDPTDDDFPVS